MADLLTARMMWRVELVGTNCRLTLEGDTLLIGYGDAEREWIEALHMHAPGPIVLPVEQIDSVTYERPRWWRGALVIEANGHRHACRFKRGEASGFAELEQVLSGLRTGS